MRMMHENTNARYLCSLLRDQELPKKRLVNGVFLPFRD